MVVVPTFAQESSSCWWSRHFAQDSSCWWSRFFCKFVVVMGSSEKFGIFFYHGGEFRQVNHKRSWEGGTYTYKGDIDPDTLGYFDVIDMIEKIGLTGWSKILFRIPFSNSYRIIRSDREIMDMLSHISIQLKVIHIFVVGGKTVEASKVEEKTDETRADKVEEKVADVGVVDIIELVDNNVDDGDGDDDDEKSEDKNEDELSDGEESEYDPSPQVSSDDDLQIDESDDEEYIELKKKKRMGGKESNLFNLIDAPVELN